MLDNIRIVLIGTTHSGNIGSAARAMKVMGLKNMVLVAPDCTVDGQAIALAAGASDIANNARIVNTIEEAVADCGLVVGTSARSRTLEWPMLDSRECGKKAIEEASQHPVALVFGRERTGLTNEELQACHFHVAIPANPEYSSLNLAMAVQTLCYEARMAWLDSQAYQGEVKEQPYPMAEDLERFYAHLEQVLDKTDFINKSHPGLVMTKLRRLFNRARPESQELNILRGVLSAVEKTIKKTQE
ncbi:tRNA (cytosine(32)/uridine(32)-2'-O)-methyltransferase TrmJ [Enterovibrio norvegicus FF-33]|uniref:tRNA (cytidine/uridine-2'-O-)-methyltransferase TrmJ n=1 Tax=Enterovibrio norvegicus FF-454 TaxID=1185651 RepID=A0A1E5C2W9_9GAMM|nr:tRNA (cytosine(32)/uridine(32)-2'-O)-methyltransferase TrmJ [Enterovibrio norvegicus]OEE59850.1 tRNA (cytosine(32)/uridine(32)-2'-O)-methyltransferase TrmJ [Enterovibrio norvegicus FF-454]OEE69851.1 tRNA (cytosine(32)/uridine(32)-2'-O)-methyltransferase TrmJ [Enterovibrio norvegicus FF-33]OEE87994.1 tRNA (cytosine(32)/uridine(32)-2'-O)-methyltransferase TrmJ [Enterovibrio norvegicus FF-162]